MKVHGGRGREALYIGCVYMPTDSNSVSVFKEDVLSFKQKGRVVLLGDFNARVANNQSMRESDVDRTDIGASDLYLVWLELGKTTKHSRKGRHVIG